MSLDGGFRKVKRFLPCRIKSIEDDRNCTNGIPQQETMLLKRSYGYFHMQARSEPLPHRKWLEEHTNLLVFTIRDPVNRLISAFNYHRGRRLLPRKKYQKDDLHAIFYIDCFAQFEDLAQTLLTSNQQLNSSSLASDPKCREIALDMLRGKVPTHIQHMHFNYEYYTTNLWSNRSKPVAVIRTESLWNDFAQIESLLGGDPEPIRNRNRHYSHGSEHFGLPKVVSPEGAVAVCCVIRTEIQRYHDLLLAAVNIDDVEKEKSLKSLFEHCGVEELETMSRDSMLSFKWESWKHSRCPTDLFSSSSSLVPAL